MATPMQNDIFTKAFTRAFYFGMGGFFLGYGMDLFVNSRLQTDPSMLDSVSIAFFVGCLAWVTTLPVVYFRLRKEAERSAPVLRGPRQL